jgi:hypothetical protein
MSKVLKALVLIPCSKTLSGQYGVDQWKESILLDERLGA